MFGEYPFYGRRIGQFMGSWATGVLTAGLAADAPVASIRCGPTSNPAVQGVGSLGVTLPATNVWITRLRVRVASTVAFTAAQQFGLYLQRFSASNMAGGGTQTPFRLGESSGFVTATPSVCLPGGANGGDLRTSSTAALTTAGVTLEGVKVPVYEWVETGPATYPVVEHDFFYRPIKLAPGEGLGLFNQLVWPLAGTAFVSANIWWDEALS